jgi:Amt family ammonium transporter
MTGDNAALASKIFVTTNLAAAVATVATLILTWIRYKKPDVSMTLNGSLAGLVAITAGCDAVEPWGAAMIGLFAGIAVVFGIEFIDKVLKVDDPVGAIGVHGVCGALGTLLVGIFATDGGLVYGGGFHYFLIQCLGVVSVAAWVGITMTILFYLMKFTIGLRVSKEEEIMGLDTSEHNLASAYADFTPRVSGAYDEDGEETDVPVTASEAIPVQHVTKTQKAASDVKMTKVEILCKQSRFEDLKTAMFTIGITGMTVTNVLGCGAQQGHPEYYRGIKMETNLLPKVQVEIVVCKVPVRTVIETAKKVLYTGHIGDGKIFVYDVENVIKVRTGEEGYDALQDVE